MLVHLDLRRFMLNRRDKKVPFRVFFAPKGGKVA